MLQADIVDMWELQMFPFLLAYPNNFNCYTFTETQIFLLNSIYLEVTFVYNLKVTKEVSPFFRLIGNVYNKKSTTVYVEAIRPHFTPYWEFEHQLKYCIISHTLAISWSYYFVVRVCLYDESLLRYYLVWFTSNIYTCQNTEFLYKAYLVNYRAHKQ